MRFPLHRCVVTFTLIIYVGAAVLLHTATVCSAPNPVSGGPTPAPSTAAGSGPGAGSAGGAAAIAPARIDPAARTLMDQMVAAHKRLKSFSCTMELVASSGGSANRTVAVIALQQPNRMALRITDAAKATTTLVSNGTNLFAAFSSHPEHYLKVPAPTGPDVFAEAIGGIRGTGPGLAALASGQDPLAAMAPVLKTLTVGAAGEVDGVAVDVVLAESVVSGNSLTAQYFIARNDHLLRKLVGTFTRGGGVPPVVLTETYHDLKANPLLSAAVFTFAPPRGATAVTDLAPPHFDPRLKVGSAPFPFTVKATDGKPISLAQYKGKVVLLDFWATWCVQCLETVPDVVAAYKRYHSGGFEIVGISLDEDYSNLVSFTKLHGMTWRQVFDGMNFQGQVPSLYRVGALPFTLLIGRDGKIAAVGQTGAGLQRAIQQALDSKPARAVRRSTRGARPRRTVSTRVRHRR